jgi:NAD(P)H-dependent FMN reductase
MDKKTNLVIIIASTRPGRIGDKIGDWVLNFTQENSNFAISVADLAVINLPIFDEPNPPMSGIYENEQTKNWSKVIGDADAFIVVTPEYNYTMPPALVNAIDYLHYEWKYKPVAFVGYGATGAIRAIQTEKLLFVNLSAMPIAQMVNMMGVYAPLVDAFKPEEKYEQAAKTMLNELQKWAMALGTLRNK